MFCFALEVEAGPFRQLTQRREEVEILLTGMGKSNAQKSVSHYLQNNSPAHLLTCGFAGALNPQLQIGEVVVQEDSIGGSPRETVQSGLISDRDFAKQGRFFFSSRMVCSAAEKQELFRTTGAEAVEMESGIIQEICREKKVACSTVRVISDTADQDLPLDFNRFVNPDCSLNHGKLALGIVTSPWKIAGLMRLQRDCKFAAKCLASFLVELLDKHQTC